MRLGRILLGFTGLAFAGYGLVCLVDPAMVAEVTGIALAGPSGKTEVTAMYGGLQFGLGVLFCHAAWQPQRERTGLMILVLLLGSLAAARLIGLLVNGHTVYNFWTVVYEGVSAALGLLALRLESGSEAQPA
jgi:hypothetical protein